MDILLKLDKTLLEQILHSSIRKALQEIPNILQEAPSSGVIGSRSASDEHLTVDEAANFLTLKKSTIYTMVSRGELPSLKRSKRIYFLKEDLISYMKAGRRKSLSDIQAEAKAFLDNKRGPANRK